MIKLGINRKFGLGAALKKAVNVPMSHLKTLVAPDGGNNNMMENSGTLFGDMSQEWQATFVENTYEKSIYQSFDAIQQANFGTLDNPHLIFTSDIPFRFVGCTGPPNEDDYEGHEIMFMLLREGPLQRCQCCGQVFKLIRLRDEVSAENDYYNSSFFKLDYNELGGADHWVQQSPLRLMPHSYEHTNFETQSNIVFTLKNTDDHDRFLTDPAYRLSELAKAEEASKNFLTSMDEIQKSVAQQYGQPRVILTKDNYENIVLARIAISRLDRQFKAVQRFHMRKILDPENHLKREKRMEERASLRIEKGNTVYLNGVTEEELRIRDYYESDEEFINQMTKGINYDYTESLDSANLKMENIEFEEQEVDNNEPDAASYIERKLFRFKYRQAFSSNEQHNNREAKMREKLSSSPLLKQAKLIGENIDNISKEQKLANELKFHELLIELAMECYSSYFEDELEEDFEFFKTIPISEKRAMLDIFQHSDLLADKLSYTAAYITIPKEKDPEHGFIKQAINAWNELDSSLLPKLKKVNGVNLSKQQTDQINKDN